MEPITERLAPMVHRTAAAGNAPKAGPGEAPETVPAPRPGDRYERSEPSESVGLYRVERDEEGTPRVRFDDPEAGNDAPKGEGPEPAEKEDTETCDTGRVDREIKALKKGREQLKRRLEGERDPGKAQKLEKELARVENELAQKDNDAYRRQNADYSSSPVTTGS